MRGFEEPFKVEGLRYQLQVSETGQVAFWLEGGQTHRGEVQHQLLFEGVLDAVDLLSVNLMKIFGRVVRRVESCVGCEKPYQFYFSRDDKWRSAIYRWLAQRAAVRLPDYWYYELQGTFYFFRKLDLPDVSSDEVAAGSASVAATGAVNNHHPAPV